MVHDTHTRDVLIPEMYSYLRFTHTGDALTLIPTKKIWYWFLRSTYLRNPSDWFHITRMNNNYTQRFHISTVRIHTRKHANPFNTAT